MRVLCWFGKEDEREGVSSTSNGLVAGSAIPDSCGVSLHGVLSAESTDVSGVLGDFHLLHLFTEGSTISVLSFNQSPFLSHKCISTSTQAQSLLISKLTMETLGCKLTVPDTVFTYWHKMSA